MTEDPTKLLAIKRDDIIGLLEALNETADLEIAGYSRSRNVVMEAYFAGWKDLLLRIRDKIHGSKDMFIDLNEVVRGELETDILPKV